MVPPTPQLPVPTTIPQDIQGFSPDVTFYVNILVDLLMIGGIITVIFGLWEVLTYIWWRYFT